MLGNAFRIGYHITSMAGAARKSASQKDNGAALFQILSRRRGQSQPDWPMPKMTVLIVEDEPMLLDILVEELELEGFRTLCAPTGDRAIFLLATESIGVLFTDIMMPGTVDGWDVAEYARTVRPDFPVVYASG